MLSYLVLGALICQFGQIDAVLNDTQVANIIDNAREDLAQITIDSVFNHEFNFHPIPFLKQINLDAVGSFHDIIVHGIESFTVMKIARDKANLERFNITFSVPKFGLSMEYEISTVCGILRNAGNLAGTTPDIVVTVPIDTTDDIATIVGEISFHFKQLSLNFSNSSDPMMDMFFNAIQCTLSDAVKVLLRDRFIPDIAPKVLEVIQASIDELNAAGTLH